MNEEPHNKESGDHTSLDINEPYEVEYWSKKFNISPDELREVMKRTGNTEIKSIEKYLTTHL